jgi:aryl-alcohol dehydrogenase-like predicted oxidoreductase
MLRRTFGDTNLEVSAISLGCWIFGVDWWGHYTDERAIEICNFSYENGVTFFDNGDAYGNGRAETLLGKWLKESASRVTRSRSAESSATIFTPTPASRLAQGAQAGFLAAVPPQGVRGIAEAMGVDHIDLYMAHNIKLPQFRDDMFAELEKMKDEGKIKTWGVSLGPAIGWREEGFKAMLEHNAKAVQTVFNLFEQHPRPRVLRDRGRHPRRRAGARA